MRSRAFPARRTGGGQGQLGLDIVFGLYRTYNP